jgi:hypothetical protein
VANDPNTVGVAPARRQRSSTHSPGSLVPMFLGAVGSNGGGGGAAGHRRGQNRWAQTPVARIAVPGNSYEAAAGGVAGAAVAAGAFAFDAAALAAGTAFLAGVVFFATSAFDAFFAACRTLAQRAFWAAETLARASALTLVHDGETGRIVRDEDFAAAVAGVLYNPAKSAEMRQGVRAHVLTATCGSSFEGVFAD